MEKVLIKRVTEDWEIEGIKALEVANNLVNIWADTNSVNIRTVGRSQIHDADTVILGTPDHGMQP